MIHARPLVLCASLAAACGGDAEVMINLPDAPAPGTGIQYRMVTTLEPGQETERCQFFTVPAEGFYINRDEVRYTPGSHHVLLYKTPYTSVPTKDERGRERDTRGVIDCAEGATADWRITGVIAGAQASGGEPMVNLPKDVGIHVPGGTVVLMNTHYINASAKPLNVDARVNVYTLPKEQVQKEGGLLFFYNPFIYLEPLSSGSARLRCPIPREITLANVQSHMHRRGVGYVADWVDEQGQRLERLYENKEWEEVPVKGFGAGKVLRAGTGLDYRCDFQNPEDRTVIQGGKTTDEMCMLIGSYYPRDPMMEVCQEGTYFGSGTKSCAETAGCVLGARDPETFYGCVVNSCPAVATQMTEALRCQFTRGGAACAEACRGDTQACQACVQQTCKPALDACLKARC